MIARLGRATLAAAAALAVLAPSAGAAVNFEAKQDFPASNPFALTTGDFNADGRTDVATASFGGSDISVLLGNGDGTLQAPRNTGGPIQQSGISAGDYNGDGRDDLVVISIGSNDARVFLSNGDGTFTAGDIEPVGSAPQDVTVASLDADNDLDIAVASQVGNNVSILSNNGDGTFAAAAPISHAGLMGEPDGVAAADFDSDGDNDLAIGTTGGGEIAYARNQGTGAFDLPVALGTQGQKLVAGDFNRDERPDLAAARTSTGNVAVLLRNPGGTSFEAAITFDPEPTATNAIAQLTAVDLDGDTILDLAVPHINGPQAGKVTVGIGNGDGSFAVGSHETAGSEPREVAAGDLNGDGNPDLMTANDGPNTVSVLRATPPSVSVTPSLAFGNVAPNTDSAGQNIVVRNNGAPRLRPGAVTLGGVNADNFRIVSNSCTAANLRIGEECGVGVVFRPTGLGGRSATVSIAGNGGGSPHVVSLGGTGANPDTGPLVGTCVNLQNGTANAETLTGTAEGDNLFGFGGADVLNGLGGNDCLTGGDGNDRLNGGEGRDTLEGNNGNDVEDGGNGNDRMSGGAGRDRMSGGAGNDSLNGVSGNDTISGGAGNDTLSGSRGDDRINGGSGKNKYSGGSGNDSITAANGRIERIDCGTGRDSVRADRRDRLKRCEKVRRTRR